jgi:DNA-binding CsgD family transcriptional regulator
MSVENPLILLTVREFDVLEQVSLRRSNKEIAQKLYIEVSTVKFHLKNIRIKLGKLTRVELSFLFQINWNDKLINEVNNGKQD